MVMRLGLSSLQHRFFFELEVFALGNLLFKNSTGLFELCLGVIKTDRVVASLQQTLGTQTFSFGNDEFLSVEELVFARCVAPVFPSLKLDFLALSLGLLDAVLECQEHTLFEPRFSHHFRQVFVLLSQVGASLEAKPSDKSLTH